MTKSILGVSMLMEDVVIMVLILVALFFIAIIIFASSEKKIIVQVMMTINLKVKTEEVHQVEIVHLIMLLFVEEVVLPQNLLIPVLIRHPALTPVVVEEVAVEEAKKINILKEFEIPQYVIDRY